MGGRDLFYKYMGVVVESVLEQACVRLVCTSVGLAGLGLEALVAGCTPGIRRAIGSASDKYCSV